MYNPGYRGRGCGRVQTRHLLSSASCGSNVRHMPHITGYTYHRFDGWKRRLWCRCANPVSHGDAFTPLDWATEYFRITYRDLAGNPIAWVDAAHQLLDAAGTDKADIEDLYRIYSEVFHSSTCEQVRLLKLETAKVKKTPDSRWSVGLSPNVIWHGAVNPKKIPIFPAIENGGHMNYMTPSGIWNPYEVRHGRPDLAVLLRGAPGQRKRSTKGRKNDPTCNVM